MTVYRSGSRDPNVVKIQHALFQAGLSSEPADGIYGSRTMAAIKTFQQQHDLPADGIVGPQTWNQLLPGVPEESAAPAGALAERCLALTGSFETSRLAPDCFAMVTGNFDGQGMSFGALQWNFGQNTLQPLLSQMFKGHPELSRQLFGEDLPQVEQACESRDSGLAFAATIQDASGKKISPYWAKRFRALGLTPEFQQIEAQGASPYYARGEALCREYGLWSQRGQALMFDICVQNGSIPAKVKSQILADLELLDASLTEAEREVQIMKIIANRRAEAANPRFVEDVRTRKLCIAEGQGVVHGLVYDLAEQFGLGLDRAVE